MAGSCEQSKRGEVFPEQLSACKLLKNSVPLSYLVYIAISTSCFTWRVEISTTIINIVSGRIRKEIIVNWLEAVFWSL